MKRAESLLREDNDEVRITEWRFSSADSTGHHRHRLDYVVVYVTAASLRIVGKEGETTIQYSPGATYFRKAGAAHEVINAGARPVTFVEIELKRPPV